MSARPRSPACALGLNHREREVGEPAVNSQMVTMCRSRREQLTYGHQQPEPALALVVRQLGPQEQDAWPVISDLDNFGRFKDRVVVRASLPVFAEPPHAFLGESLGIVHGAHGSGGRGATGNVGSHTPGAFGSITSSWSLARVFQYPADLGVRHGA